MNRRVRVAQVATAEISVRFLLTSQILAISDSGYSVTAVCAPGAWTAELEKLGVSLTHVPMAREPAPLQDLRSLFCLTRCFASNDFSIVNTHTPKAGLLGPLAARLAGVPVVIHTVHGFLFHDQMSRAGQFAFEFIERCTAFFADYLFFQSQEDLETARRLGFMQPNRLFFIGNGVDTDFFSPDSNGATRRQVRCGLGIGEPEFVVGIVARLTYEKGFRELFEAARRLEASRPNMRFLVVGPTEADQNDSVTASEIAEMEQTGRFTFLGMRRDTRELYTAMDLFVLPSHREGIPRALMEACAMAVPVIATNIRGCREVIDDGNTGWLVPVRDPASLANAIARAADAPDRARAMGLAARARITQRFTDRLVNERIINALDAIVSRSLRHRDQEGADSHAI